MFTKIITATLDGVEGSPVVVETDIRRGLPCFTVVGLADTTIKEACSRIKPAMLNCGLQFPNEKVTINLSPAGCHKEGTHFDLPIAVGLMSCDMNLEMMKETAFLGELSLDGSINNIKGALPLVMCLRRAGIKQVILPKGNADEVSILKDIDILPAEDLNQVIDHVYGERKLTIYNGKKIYNQSIADMDYGQVLGQESVKRALMIAVAGEHGVLLVGSPGCGKTMVAKRLPTIMPKLSYEEILEITGVYSVAGLLSENMPLVDKRPFRSPHHTISVAGMLGGGGKPRPGEMSLAHRGVLFLDEFGEFSPAVIDALRQPIEEGIIRITRNNHEVRFPARAMIVAAANPCKCGNLWDERKICTCSTRQKNQYVRKLGGPFSDRIDMHIKMYPVERYELEENANRQLTMNSDEMREIVERAVERQKKRYANTAYATNGTLDDKGLDEFCSLDRACKGMLAAAYERLGISMRARSKIIKVARTIADIEESEHIKQEHLAEALQYRISEREDTTL